MPRSRKIKTLGVAVCFILLGLSGTAHADEKTASSGRNYRQEVRDRLNKLQSSLDLLFANHQLTTDQYQTENERVRQLRLQVRVDAQEDQPMAKDERNTDFDLIGQIDREASQWAVTNSSGAPLSANAGLPDLQAQYATLNAQYQTLDARYTAAVSERDPQTAQTIRTQMDILRQQMDDVRSRMQQQIGSTPNP